jgi:FKBP-type peptidyl-prolyl cis-trans isomerase FkpA
MICRFRLFIALFLAFCLTSCHNKPEAVETNKLTQNQVTAKLLDANKSAVELENTQINKLIKSSGWDMIETPTGLRYQVLEKGNGPKTRQGKLVRFEYEVKLYSGEMIYSSAKSGPKEFSIGSGGVESGLEEAILLLRVGDRARLIIPSYLAHGLSGDQDKIPPKATLIYTLELIDLK